MSEAMRFILRTHLTELLPRLRQQLPFPFAPERLYDAAFEPHLAEWFRGSPTAERIAQRNLLRATARDQIIHFDLSDPVTSSDSALGANLPFWVRMERGTVCPSSKLLPFLLTEDVRDDPALWEWYRAAEKLDTEIRWFHDKIYTLAPLFQSRTDVAFAWPEAVKAVPSLMVAVHSRPLSQSAPSRKRIVEIRERMQNILTVAERTRLTEMLATAVMLPADTKLAAWIGYNREDE